MHLLSRPRHVPRAGGWTSDKVVTFIVAFAATRSVTLAAHAAGMSRKAAYALRARDAAFAAAWAAAVKAGAERPLEGDKVEEVEEPPISSGQGNASLSRAERERAFVGLLAQLRESPPLAPRPAAQ